MPLRIVTYNFLGGGSARRSAHWEMLREGLLPDIVLAQECRPPPGGHAREAALWAKANSRGWGTGLYLARGAIRRLAVRGFSGWVTGGEIDHKEWANGRPLRVFSIHCPHRERGYVKTMDLILDRLARLSKDADLILGGDFNVAAGLRGSADLVHMNQGERRLLERMAGQFDLIACWQAMNPGVPLAQTLRWSGNRAAPYHCDGIFVPRSWRERLESCRVVSGPEWDRLSDHNPVLAVFK